MLRDYPHHVLPLFQVIVPSIIDFPERVTSAAVVANKHLGDDATWAWVGNNNTVAFRDPSRRRFFAVGYSLVLLQTLGLSPWLDQLSNNATLISISLDALGVKLAKRVGFKCKIFFDLKMQHPELVNAFFGSYLVERDKLSTVSGALDDVVVRLIGKESNANFDIGLYPQTPQQVETELYNWPNIEHFNEPGRLKSLPVHEFLGGINRPSLTVECDLFREEVKPAEVNAFFQTCFDTLDKIVTRSVKHLLTLPSED